MNVPSARQFTLLACLLMSTVSVPATVGSAAESPGQFAVLIGVDQYRQTSRLSFAVGSTLRLSQTLRRYGGYRSADVLLLIDAAADPAQHPTRANLQSELPRWLSKAGPGDQVLIAFSGHAYRADDGQLYLAALDTDPADLAKTGVAMSWLREQLTGCPARSKIVLFDTRQTLPKQAAGGGPGVSAAELAEPLKSLPGVAVLAASSAGQASLIWTDQQQTLFAYWLVEGLKGHADADRDGQVTTEELSGYVQRHAGGLLIYFGEHHPCVSSPSDRLPFSGPRSERGGFPMPRKRPGPPKEAKTRPRGSAASSIHLICGQFRKLGAQSSHLANQFT